jgi:hypothetical protein
MEETPKLKTKLIFRFNIDDIEFDNLDFLSGDPKEKTDKEIRIIERRVSRDSRKKSNPKLF